jgi:hypothetical protein
MQKITSALKNPLMWVGVVVGIVLATAFSVLRKPAKIVASKIPGNDVAPSA